MNKGLRMEFKKGDVFDDVTKFTVNQENSLLVNNILPPGKINTKYNGGGTQENIGNIKNFKNAKNIIPKNCKPIEGNKSGISGNFSTHLKILNSKKKNTNESKNKENMRKTIQEYENDIFSYLYELEKTDLNIPNIKRSSSNIDILLNWIIKVHQNLRLLQETLFLTIFIINKYESKEITSITNFQLLGLTSLFIASKIEEVKCPEIYLFVLQSHGNITKKEIINFEVSILNELQYELQYANPIHFLRRLSRKDDFNIVTRTFAKYFLEITMVDHRFIRFPNSLRAAASMFLSKKILRKGQWNDDFVRSSGGYTKDKLIPVCKHIIKYILEPIIHNNLQRKYQSNKYFRASIISREWILDVMEKKKMCF